MKTKTIDRRVVLGVTIVAAVAALVASYAHAGDDYRQRLVADGRTSTCSTILRPKTKYVIQCSQAAQVAVTANPDGGITANNSFKIPADALYDIPTTADQHYICVVGAAAVSDAGCIIGINRNVTE